VGGGLQSKKLVKLLFFFVFKVTNRSNNELLFGEISITVAWTAW
jgi:hypothetical protein